MSVLVSVWVSVWVYYMPYAGRGHEHVQNRWIDHFTQLTPQPTSTQPHKQVVGYLVKQMQHLADEDAFEQLRALYHEEKVGAAAAGQRGTHPLHMHTDTEAHTHARS